MPRGSRGFRAGGGGGGVPGLGNVEWGPDYGGGAGSDGVTHGVGVAIDLSDVALAGDFAAGVAVDLQQLALDYQDGPRPGVAVDLSDVALDYLDGPSLGAAIDLQQLALAGDFAAGVALAGTALGAPFYQTQETQNGANNSNVTIDKPSGVVEGDFMLAYIAQPTTVATTPTFTPPAGWTSVRVQSRGGATGLKLEVFRKFAGAAEPANYQWTSDVTGGIGGAIHSVKAVDATTPVDVVDGQGAAGGLGNEDPVCPSITTTVVNTMRFCIGAKRTTLNQNVNYTPPANHVERTDFNTTEALGVHSLDLTSATRVQAAAAASGAQTLDGAPNALGEWVAIHLALRPAEIQL